jgi:hypothetical protein
VQLEMYSKLFTTQDQIGSQSRVTFAQVVKAISLMPVTLEFNKQQHFLSVNMVQFTLKDMSIPTKSVWTAFFVSTISDFS